MLDRGAIERLAATVQSSQILAGILIPEARPPRGEFVERNPDEFYPYYFAIGKLLAPRRIAEIGVWWGYSLWAMAMGARAGGRKDVEVHGYDNETYNPGCLAWAREAFMKAKIPYNVAHMDSQKVDLFPFYDVDLYHIDGDHTYEAARHDIRCAWQGLGAKGVMIVDDVGWHPGIRQAVEEFAASHPVRLMLLPTLKGMAILEK
jgi:predicted O-methyltransferase YrrM